MTRDFDECRADVHNQYFDRLTKLGFQDDIKFEKFEDLILCYGRGVSELISQKLTT